MNKSPLVLKSLWTGKCYEFETAREASAFLCRSHGYFGSCEKDGTIISHKETREQFEKIVKVKRDKVKIKKMLSVQECQLCTYCARASALCSWTRWDEPVEGWEAEQTLGPDGKPYSYKIIKCPLFLKDADTREGRREQRKMLLQEEMWEKEVERKVKEKK